MIVTKHAVARFSIGMALGAAVAVPHAWGQGADVTALPRPDFWVPDGTVNAVVATNGVIFLGGDFRLVGPPHGGGGVGLDRETGAGLVNLPRVDGAVHAVAQDGLGGRYLGGSFVAVGGIACTNLARLTADGQVDMRWRPPAQGGGVFALAVADGRVYVGGHLTNVAGVVRWGLAALDPVTGAVLDWDPVVNGAVRTLEAVPEARVIIVGGEFTSIGGQFRTGLAAVNMDTGIASLWNPAANGPVLSVARLALTLFVAGNFTQIGGALRNGVAAIDVFSGFAGPWAPQANGPVQALAVSCTQVFAGGVFTFIGGQPRNYVAALDPITGQATEWDARLTFEASGAAGVSALAVRDDVLYVGGRFTSVGRTPRTGVAGVDLQTGRPLSWNPAGGGAVRSLDVSGANVFVGGEAITVGGRERRYLAALDAATGHLLDWNPGASGAVHALAYANGTLYVGGAFTNVGGLPRSGLAAIGADGKATGWAPSLDSPAWALAVTADTVYAGGQFIQISGQTRPGLGAIHRATGQVTPWNPSANNSVFALARVGDVIYAGGQFTVIGGVVRSGLAGLDRFTGQATALNLPANNSVLTLAAHGAQLYVGGDFTFIGGRSRSGFAEIALDGAGSVTALDTRANGPIYAVLPAKGGLYVGGNFTSIGGAARNYLALLNQTTGTAEPWRPEASAFVRALDYDGAHVVAGGSFFLLGGRHRPGLAAFGAAGAPFVAVQPVATLVQAGARLNLGVAAEGEGPIEYRWRFNGVRLPGQIGPTLQVDNAAAALSGEYDVEISNRLGRTVSLPARVVVYRAPVIVDQPLRRAVDARSDAEFGVTASGDPPPTFQWRLNGVNLAGANQASLRLSNLDPTNSGSYSVVVVNAGGAVSSRSAELEVRAGSLALADTLAGRTTLSADSGLGRASTLAFTRESGEPRHAGKLGGRSGWIGWRASADGIASFSTRGSHFDTLLAVYQGSRVDTLAEVGADDDSGGFLTSKVSFSARAGQEYLIAVDGFGGAGGDVVLSWNLDTSLALIPRIVMQPRSQVVRPGDTVSFSVQATSLTPFSYQWLNDCAAIFNATNATLVLTNVYPALAGSYRALVYNQLWGDISEPAFLEFGPDAKTVSRDKFYDLLSDPAPGAAAGPASIPSRQAYSSVAAGVPGSQIFNNTGATTEPGEPNHGGTLGGASRWFRIRVSSPGTLNLDTIGSEIDTVLAVYTGTTLLDLQQVASDDNSAPDGFSALLRFSATPGIDYLVAIDGVNGSQGVIVFNWRLDSGAAGGALRLTQWKLLDTGRIQFRVEAPENRPYRVEMSEDLQLWRPIQTNTPANGFFDYTDPEAATYPRRYYRASPAGG